MGAPYVDGDAILAHVAGDGTPSAVPADVAWADTVAAAIEGVIAHRMDGVTVAADSAADSELRAAALTDGAAAYLSRRAPHGVMSMGPDGDAVRLGRDIVRALEPVFGRYAPLGIG